MPSAGAAAAPALSRSFSLLSIAATCLRLHFPARRRMPLPSSTSAAFAPMYCTSSSSSSSAFSPSSSSSAARAASSAAGAAVDQEEGSRSKPWLLVGLGNPGKMYDGTRHNVGFDMVDSIAQAEGISVNNVRFKALFGKGLIGNVPVMLAKPQTFMNASGESIYDDLDLPFASLRLLPKGGHGGHNGMRSVINHFKGAKDFPRLRIGIGRPPGKMDPVNFVLRPFNKKELEELSFTFQLGAEAVRILVLEGFDKSATLVNSKKSAKLLNS